MDRASLNELFDYTTFTWTAYERAVGALPPDALTRSMPDAGWPALRDLLFHLAAGWDQWLRDRLALDLPLDATPQSIASWSDLQAHRDRTRGWLRRAIDETADLDALTEQMWQSAGGDARVSAADVFSHILLHERGHHGDVTTLISALGGTPPLTDYLVYLFFKRRAMPR